MQDVRYAFRVLRARPGYFFSTATGSAPMPYVSGPTIWSDSFSNGVPTTARRTRVFFTTLK